MPADGRGAELRRPPRAGDRVGDAQQIDYDLRAVQLATADRLGDRPVVRRAEHRDEVGAGLRRDLDLERSGVHHLHVGDDPLRRERALELPHGVEPFALDQRRAGLDPVRPTLDRLAGRVERAGQVLEVEGDLEDGPVEPHRREKRGPSLNPPVPLARLVADGPAAGTVRLLRGDARRLDGIAAASVELVVTSPPYPMLEQWDEQFRTLGAVGYAAQRRLLADAWLACRRVLVPGGLLAVVVGDALRSDDGGFRLWPNHAATLLDAESAGLRPLPYLLWKKPTNRPNAYLGSGFLPPNAYVTLDCEFVLLFRNGRLRQFPRHDPRRAASRFTRAERDAWFSQVWGDVRGARQAGRHGRTGAFPPELAERLVRMFSVVGDRVLDPFAGTGTTLWAAARHGRHATGVEIDPRRFAALGEEARRRGFATPRGAAGASRAAARGGRPASVRRPAAR